MSVKTRIEDNIVYATLCNPPVNAIGVSIRQGLLEAVRLAERERVDRVILSGAGQVFAAGADTREFDSVPVEPHLPDVLNAIETSFVPWIAAINGIALGGGAEIALACRMRILKPDAVIGFPEVMLGVIPGAGGTQRLPRLIGLAAALNAVSTGKSFTAMEAQSLSLIYAIEEDPIEAAFMVNSEELQCCVPTWELPAPELDPALVEQARRVSLKKLRNQDAPSYAIDVMSAGLSMNFFDAMRMERETFLKLRASSQAKSLRHIFFAERSAKKPASLVADSVPLECGVVVGGGTMGTSICYALVSAGINVTLLETNAQTIDQAKNNFDSIIEASLDRGLIDNREAVDRRSRVAFSEDYKDASTATFAIEAAFESIEVKIAIFKKLSDYMPADAVLATNTSYLDVNEIARSVEGEARVIGLHFFAPAHIMKLLEIVKAEKTSDVALATGFSLGKLLRKIPVVSGVCDGFIGNRILARYREAADTVLLEGSTPWEIDEAMVEFGYPLGPYEAQDLSGLDIAHANRRRQDASRDPNRRYVLIADRMVELGKLGKKVGAGWYRYPGGGGKVEDPIVADLALEEARFADIQRVEYSSTDIQERLVLAMINEAADILSEGIADSASDVDIVTVAGYGFPRWRGGLMHYANCLGAQIIVNKLEALAVEDPVAWKVSPYLRECADKSLAIV